VAESHLKSGKKDKAIEALEDVIQTYPKHSLVPEAQRMLEDAKKK
jgi:TolA-binding protein